MDFSLRVHRKAFATDSSPDRDQQFRYLSSLRTRFERQGLPMISVDSKKRELVGNLKNNGVKWARAPVRVKDHDFRSDAIGVVIPHGIYGLLANRGSFFVGVSHDTAAFAAHSITDCWKRDGADRYRRGRQLLILADRLQQQLPHRRLENRPSSPTLQPVGAHCDRGSLSYRLPNRIPSSIVCFPKSTKTGPPSLSTVTPKSST
jgi:hypothetical protein